LIGPTLMAPPQTSLSGIAVTSVWKPEVGRVICQNFGDVDAAAEHVASLHDTRKYPCPVAPTAPSGANWIGNLGSSARG